MVKDQQQDAKGASVRCITGLRGLMHARCGWSASNQHLRAMSCRSASDREGGFILSEHAVTRGCFLAESATRGDQEKAQMTANPNHNPTPSLHHLVTMTCSTDPVVDADLRDVFKLLYADDDDADWAMSDEEDEVSYQTPPT